MLASNAPPSHTPHVQHCLFFFFLQHSAIAAAVDVPLHGIGATRSSTFNALKPVLEGECPRDVIAITMTYNDGVRRFCRLLQ